MHVTLSNRGHLNQIECLESDGSDGLGLLAQVTVAREVSGGP